MTDAKKLILGTVQFGLSYGINNNTGQTTQEQAFQILDLAFEQGIKHLDTAAAYGESEKVLGNYLTKHKDKDFKIITKLVLQDNSCSESLSKSLECLQVEKVDTLLFHSYNDYREHKVEAAEMLKQLKGEKFRKIGVSVYTNEEIEQLLDDKEVEVVQTPFNLLDNEQQRGKALRELKSAGKEVHTRSVFLQGLFFKPVETFPDFLQPLKSPVGELRKIAEEQNVSMNRMALGYVLSKDYIDGVLIGVDSVQQLKENLLASQHKLSAALIAQIDSFVVYRKELLNPSTWKAKV